VQRLVMHIRIHRRFNVRVHARTGWTVPTKIWEFFERVSDFACQKKLRTPSEGRLRWRVAILTLRGPVIELRRLAYS